MSKVDYLIHVDGYNLNTDTVETLYFGTSDFSTLPTDSPSNQFYAGVLSSDITFQSDLFGNARLIGEPTISIGAVVMNNIDGSLDYLDDYAFGGRELIIYRMVDDDHANKTVWLSGKVETNTASYENVELTIRDKSFSLKQPIQTNTYLGNNSGGNGIEGDADNIKDTVKPLAFGRIQNATPILVNYSKQIYQIHDGSVQSIDNVYDGRTSFSFQSNVVDNATLQGLSVSSGNYATCLNEGLIKLGNIPQKGITVDLQGDNTGGYINTASDIIKRIIETKTDLSGSDLDLSSFSQFKTDFGYETGVYIDTKENSSTVISDVIGPLNYWCFNRNGLMTVGVFNLPAGTPVASYDIDETTDNESPINRLINNDTTNGTPVYRLNYQWGKNYTIQKRDNVYTSVSEQTVAFTSLEYRTTTEEDLNVQTKYPLSPELTIPSNLYLQGDADTDKARVYGIYNEKKFFYNFVVHDVFADNVSLSNVIELFSNRFGISNGKLLSVVSISENAGDKTVEITAFG